MKRSLDVLIPDAAALVIGVGGLGQMSLAYLRQLTGGVTIAADRSAAAHEMAAELGADLVLVSDEHTAEAEAIAWMLARIGSFAIDCTRDFDL